ncbi:hypothetical protein SAMN02799625_05926 [Methylobacterium sp. UNC300MFChir4.1]|nr:hypothetical protein SAMN02799625_05926 [Methylobacterium sp. UNC300MFChir4.1]
MTPPLWAVRRAAQDQPTDDVLLAETIELQVHNPVEGKRHDGLPFEHKEATLADLVRRDPTMKA